MSGPCGAFRIAARVSRSKLWAPDTAPRRRGSGRSRWEARTREAVSSQQSAVRGSQADMKNFRDLQVWSKAHELTLRVYRETARFPREELFGLTSQIRRCSASVAANIAEGCGRRGNAELHRFLQVASGSASELDYHLLLARDLCFLGNDQYGSIAKQLGELRRMLTALILRVDAERQG